MLIRIMELGDCEYIAVAETDPNFPCPGISEYEALGRLVTMVAKEIGLEIVFEEKPPDTTKKT